MLDLKLEDLYFVGKAIGRGSFAKVRHTQHLESGRKAVVKIIPKAKAGRSYKAHVLEAGVFEVMITTSLENRHSNVAEYMDLLESPMRYYAVIESLDGLELAEALAQKERWSPRACAAATADLLRALQHIHTVLGVYHRDVKLENLRYRGQTDQNAETFGDLVLFDFGLARFVDQEWDGGFGGTAIYAAPEVVQEIQMAPISRSNTGGYSPAVDLWAAGVLLFVFLAGDFPADEEDVWAADFSELTQKAIRDLEATKAQEGSSIPRGLLDGLLDPDPARRLDAASALQDPWLRHASGVTTASRYDAALTKSSASKESKDYCGSSSKEGYSKMDRDLTPSYRPDIDHFYSTTITEISTTCSKSTYGGPWETPGKTGRQPAFSDADETPTYACGGRAIYGGAKI
jgi:serine/threonine protein kinase